MNHFNKLFLSAFCIATFSGVSFTAAYGADFDEGTHPYTRASSEDKQKYYEGLKKKIDSEWPTEEDDNRLLSRVIGWAYTAEAADRLTAAAETHDTDKLAAFEQRIAKGEQERIVPNDWSDIATSLRQRAALGRQGSCIKSVVDTRAPLQKKIEQRLAERAPSGSDALTPAEGSLFDADSVNARLAVRDYTKAKESLEDILRMIQRGTRTIPDVDKALGEEDQQYTKTVTLVAADKKRVQEKAAQRLRDEQEREAREIESRKQRNRVEFADKKNKLERSRSLFQSSCLIEIDKKSTYELELKNAQQALASLEEDIESGMEITPERWQTMHNNVVLATKSTCALEKIQQHEKDALAQKAAEDAAAEKLRANPSPQPTPAPEPRDPVAPPAVPVAVTPPAPVVSTPAVPQRHPETGATAKNSGTAVSVETTTVAPEKKKTHKETVLAFIEKHKTALVRVSLAGGLAVTALTLYLIIDYQENKKRKTPKKSLWYRIKRGIGIIS